MLSNHVPSLIGKYADPTFTPLEFKAMEWLDGFYQLEHLLATRQWAIKLAGSNATDALKFAALVHDSERFFPGGPTGTPQNGFDDPDYLIKHSIRSAEFVEEWLQTQNPEPDDVFKRRVRALVLRHEFGGNTEEDILQAADSLAFLSTFDWLVVDWIRRGSYTNAGAREKLDWTMTRIRPESALRLALPLYTEITAVLDNPGSFRMDLAERRALAGNWRLLTGECCQASLN
ncbi:HD domain-containing protein [Limibacillus halophilus]|uniref:HD domain-containing protein n=1 Tax=Limibacillus halophilus TaxID=1579333 RepID=A0A839ST20_9PROT|nr:hypothetical protein [Limibacillus halophilus]MBB3064496.1 hypothetical protein [Limibacillus halophilus]